MLEVVGIAALIFVALFVVRFVARMSHQSQKDISSGRQVLDMFEDLGSFADQIAKDAEGATELDIAMSGAATVAAQASTVREVYGLTVKDGSIFQLFFSAVEEHDISRMSSIVKNMAEALSKVNGKNNKGALIYFWISGDE